MDSIIKIPSGRNYEPLFIIENNFLDKDGNRNMDTFLLLKDIKFITNKSYSLPPDNCNIVIAGPKTKTQAVPTKIAIIPLIAGEILEYVKVSDLIEVYFTIYIGENPFYEINVMDTYNNQPQFRPFLINIFYEQITKPIVLD